ncbi:hypothetical protein RB195_005075 [Necator americanus]|uniref:Uncharacterized protein n=1 Tax=Necator americanus TaxID=51031 RepID=A0ABR1BPC8_NECAM
MSSEEFVGFELEEATGQKRKFWTEVVKEDLTTFGVYRQFRLDVRFRGIWNNDELICSVQALEKVGQNCVQGRHTSAKMRVIALCDDISPPIKLLS